MIASAKGRVEIPQCPVCTGTKFVDPFDFRNVTIFKCADCGLALQNPQLSDDELTEIYGSDYFIGGDDQKFTEQFSIVKRGTARMQLARISNYLGLDHGPQGRKLIEIGCGHGNFLLEAQSAGYDVQGLEFSQDAAQRANSKLGGPVVTVGSTQSVDLPSAAFDVCVMADVIEHVRDPYATMQYVHRILKPGGVLFIATPSTESWSAKVLGSAWMEYKLEHLYYFGPKTLGRLLGCVGFQDVAVHTGRKSLTIDYIAGHFEKFPVPVLSSLVCGVNSLLPRAINQRPISLTASGIDVLATKSAS